MDLLSKLPEEVQDEIFPYLKVRDIKKASLVSKNWYNIIGKSTVCMKKLCIYKMFDVLDDFDGIMNSSRQYQYLSIITDEEEVTKNTKFLRIIRGIIDKFAESLLSITISQDLKPKEDLLKLKFLEFHGFSDNIIVSNGLITKAKNLRELIIRRDGLDKKSLKYVKDAIGEKESLKMLEISDINIIKGLNGLKLEKFLLHGFGFGFELDKPAILDFLNTQMSSLQIVECPLLRKYVNYFLTNFPNLHTLIISPEWYFRFVDSAKPEYPANRTIKKLMLMPYFYRTELRTVNAFDLISKLQNLQEVNFHLLIPEFLPHLYNCSSLKIVKFKNIGNDFTDIQRNEMAYHERIKFTLTRDF